MTTTVSGSSITFNDNTTQNTSAYGGGFAFRNRIINGDCRIDQRNAGASVTPTTTATGYAVDRFGGDCSVNSKYTVQQSTTAPTGFKYSLKATSSSAYSVGAGDYFYISQVIEGYNVADLDFGTANAKTVTLSFWVQSSLTGTFGGSFRNGAGNRSYPFTYTISSANTWEQKTVTITGDTSGTWLTTNGAGLRVEFGLGVGSTYSGTAGVWSSSTFLSATGATSVVGTNGATFYITGVQLEKGSTATSFDYRPYSAELAMCQRYYQQWSYESANKYVAGLGSAVITSEVDFAIPLGISMRSSPTISYSGLGITDGTNANITPSSVSTYQASTNVAGMYFNGTGFTQFRPYYLRTSASTGYLAASAEL